jgi:hypothetical protein
MRWRAVRTGDLHRTTLLRQRLNTEPCADPKELDERLAAAVPIVRAAGELALGFFDTSHSPSNIRPAGSGQYRRPSGGGSPA